MHEAELRTKKEAGPEAEEAKQVLQGELFKEPKPVRRQQLNIVLVCPQPPFTLSIPSMCPSFCPWQEAPLN